MPAQGNALGKARINEKALKGRLNLANVMRALNPIFEPPFQGS